MAEAYSSYVVESHGGKTRAYVKGWIESETDKTATIYVWGCAQGNRLAQYGVRTRVYIDGSQVSTTTAAIFSASGIADVGAISARLTVNKDSSGRNVSIACSISGETVSGYGPICGSATATAYVWVGAKVLNPPSAPTNLTASRNAAANIELTWTNNASNATWTCIDRMRQGAAWEEIVEQERVFSSYTDAPGIGAYKYRVRYWNADGYSSYSNETDYIATLCAPAAPSLLSPPSGATIDAGLTEVKLTWQHNPKDASAQTAAKVMWSTDNLTFKTVELESEGSYALPVSQNETIYWKVATRGAHEDYGAESAVAHFLVRTGPVAILDGNKVITSVPIRVEWGYEDAYGTQSSALIEILDTDEKLLFSKNQTSELVCTITADEFAPEHGASYIIRLTTTSTTSLSYTTQKAVTVQYDPPARPNLAVATNARRAENTIVVFEGSGDEGTPATTSIALFRDGALIAKDLHTGKSYIDKTPPLDRRITYTAVAYAHSGSLATKNEITVVRSRGFAFFNFGDKVTKVGMNIAISDQTQNAKEYYVAASSKYPKVFYGEQVERAGSISADVFWAHDALGYGEEAMLSAVEELKDYGGPVVLRLPYSDAFTASVDVAVKRSTSAYNIAEVEIEWKRVE